MTVLHTEPLPAPLKGILVTGVATLPPAYVQDPVGDELGAQLALPETHPWRREFRLYVPGHESHENLYFPDQDSAVAYLRDLCDPTVPEPAREGFARLGWTASRGNPVPARVREVLRRFWRDDDIRVLLTELTIEERRLVTRDVLRDPALTRRLCG